MTNSRDEPSAPFDANTELKLCLTNSYRGALYLASFYLWNLIN